MQFLSFLKLLKIGLVAIALTGCYNSAMMRVSGEARDTCQSDSDCHADYFCVKNISPNSTLGECVSNDNYDPWANRRLEDIIKLKNKTKESPKAIDPDTSNTPEQIQQRLDKNSKQCQGIQQKSIKE